MTNWRSKVKIKHLFTEDEDFDSIQKSMSEIANVLSQSPAFFTFRSLKKFKEIPKGDDVFKPVDYANRLLSQMYDFADEHRIWID